MQQQQLLEVIDDEQQPLSLQEWRERQKRDTAAQRAQAIAAVHKMFDEIEARQELDFLRV